LGEPTALDCTPLLMVYETAAVFATPPVPLDAPRLPLYRFACGAGGARLGQLGRTVPRAGEHRCCHIAGLANLPARPDDAPS
jgi:hypothetical protein